MESCGLDSILVPVSVELQWAFSACFFPCDEWADRNLCLRGLFYPDVFSGNKYGDSVLFYSSVSRYITFKSTTELLIILVSYALEGIVNDVPQAKAVFWSAAVFKFIFKLEINNFININLLPISLFKCIKKITLLDKRLLK